MGNGILLDDADLGGDVVAVAQVEVQGDRVADTGCIGGKNRQQDPAAASVSQLGQQSGGHGCCQ